MATAQTGKTGPGEMKQAVSQVQKAMVDPDKIPDEVFERMNISREDFKEVVARMAERDARTPPVGSPAPDFELELLDAQGQRTGEYRRLSSHRGRPVALVFGSYT